MAIGGDAHTDDAVWILDDTIKGRVAFFDFIDVVHGLGYLAPDSVLTVQKRGLL